MHHVWSLLIYLYTVLTFHQQLFLNLINNINLAVSVILELDPNKFSIKKCFIVAYFRIGLGKVKIRRAPQDKAIQG